MMSIRKTVSTVLVIWVFLGVFSNGVAYASGTECIVVFDTSGSMQRLLPAALEHAQTTVGQTTAIATVLAVDESGQDFGTFDLSTADGQAQFASALKEIRASANDTNLDEVVVRIEHVAYRRGLPAGTPVLVYSDNISDPTPGHPTLDLASYATAVTDLGDGLKCFTMEVGRGFATGAQQPLPAPAVVSGLAASVLEGPIVEVSWDPAELAAAYVIRRVVGDEAWNEVAVVSELTYADTDVDEGDVCQYVVIAQSADGVQAAPSTILRTQVPVPPPARPIPVPVMLAIVAAATVILVTAVAPRLVPGQEMAEPGAFGRVTPLGLRKITLGRPDSGLEIGARFLPTPGRAARVLGRVRVNGCDVEDGTRIRLREGDQLQLGATKLQFRTMVG